MLFNTKLESLVNARGLTDSASLKKITTITTVTVWAITDLICFGRCTVYPEKYAHGFVVLCFVVVMQSLIMNSHGVFIHIHRGCFAGTGAIVRLPQCQWSKPDGYGKISQCITTTKHNKAKTVCIFLGIYCIWVIMVDIAILSWAEEHKLLNAHVALCHLHTVWSWFFFLTMWMSFIWIMNKRGFKTDPLGTPFLFLV